MKYKACCILIILFIFYPVLLSAAFKSDSDAINQESVWNPNKLPDDLLLPMPCGISLAMRGVAIPSSSIISDKTFLMGISNPQDESRQIYERQFSGHISAPFTQKELPREWHKKLVKIAGSTMDTWYFIGKYEVSEFQWLAVMNALTPDGDEIPEQCPQYDKKAALPVTNITWFQVQEFLNKYNAWLMKYHQKELPVFEQSKNIGFLRLPTEEEWEFAARGGIKVAPEWWISNDFFPYEEDKKIDDYAVFNNGQPLSGPVQIGSRNPNPLGLYDTAGNVGEMVDGFFRMSVADMSGGAALRRLHGAAGGILTKGGGYRSNQFQILPGTRDEMPLYTISGPGKRSDLGFRVILASINFPNAERLDTVRNEENNASKAPKSVKDLIAGQASALDAIHALADSTDGELKNSLLQIYGKLRDKELAEAAADKERLENSFRSLLYQAETLRAFAYRYTAVKNQRAKIEELLKQKLNESDKKEAQHLYDIATGHLHDYFNSLLMGANYYKSNLGILLNESSNEVDRLVKQASEEYGSKSIFNTHMQQNIKKLEEYLKLAAQKGLTVLTQEKILKGIIPEEHYRQLPL